LSLSAPRRAVRLFPGEAQEIAQALKLWPARQPLHFPDHILDISGEVCGWNAR
jgi:hypothetical protein